MHFNWHAKTPRVLLSAVSPQFDPTTIRHWKEEGFTVSYLRYGGDVKQYAGQLATVSENLEFGDKFALVGAQL